MSQNIKHLTLGSREIILLGTAHISQDSISEVNTIIQNEMPNCVAIELDEQRFASMKNPEAWRNLDIIKVLKQKQGWVLLANLVLSSFQKRMGADVGVKPGEEMKAAAEKAEELELSVALVDRPIQTTLRRAWAKNSFWGKCKLLAVLVSSIFENEKISSDEIEKLKNTNEMDQMMDGLAFYLPAVKTVLIDERDQFLASRIWEAEGQKMVAVLGAGHLPGVEKWLNSFASREKTPDTTDIATIPAPGVAIKVVGWVVPAVIVALIVLGFFRGGIDTSVNMLLQWWLVNGSLAALGAALAFGHPLSILVSFVGAWFTAINPFIGIGLLSGLVQAWVCKPAVKDMEYLMSDITSVKGFYKNRILRTLLVFFLSSVGSSIGTLLAFPALVRILIK